MANFWQELVAFANAVIDCISRYVHSPLAQEIDTEIAVMVKEVSDNIVDIIRDIMDVYGR